MASCVWPRGGIVLDTMRIYRWGKCSYFPRLCIREDHRLALQRWSASPSSPPMAGRYWRDHVLDHRAYHRLWAKFITNVFPELLLSFLVMSFGATRISVSSISPFLLFWHQNAISAAIIIRNAHKWGTLYIPIIFCGFLVSLTMACQRPLMLMVDLPTNSTTSSKSRKPVHTRLGILVSIILWGKCLLWETMTQMGFRNWV